MKTWYLFLVEVRHKPSHTDILEAYCLFENSRTDAKLKLTEALKTFSNSFWNYELPTLTAPLVKFAALEITSINVLGTINSKFSVCGRIKTTEYKNFKNIIYSDYYNEVKSFKSNPDDYCDFTKFL